MENGADRTAGSEINLDMPLNESESHGSKASWQAFRARLNFLGSHCKFWYRVSQNWSIVFPVGYRAIIATPKFGILCPHSIGCLRPCRP